MNSFYFTHDYNAANDTKVLFLRQQLGMEGYGIFWFIVEQLAQSGGFLPIKITPVLSMQMQVTEAKVRSVITDYELFDIVDENFYSERLNKHLQIRKQLSEFGKKGAKNRWENGHPISHPNGLPNGNKERKERKERNKEKKEKEVFTPPSLDEVKQFFTDNGYVNADKAWNYYNDGNWKDSKGNQVLNWKQKMRVVWFKDENKKPTNQLKISMEDQYRRERERLIELNK